MSLSRSDADRALSSIGVSHFCHCAGQQRWIHSILVVRCTEEIGLESRLTRLPVKLSVTSNLPLGPLHNRCTKSARPRPVYPTVADHRTRNLLILRAPAGELSPVTQEVAGSNPVAPANIRVVTISGRRLELVESTALLSFTSGLTHPRNRVRKSDTVGSVSDLRLSRRG